MQINQNNVFPIFPCVFYFFKYKKYKTKKVRATRMIRCLVKGFLVLLLTFSVCSALLWYV